MKLRWKIVTGATLLSGTIAYISHLLYKNAVDNQGLNEVADHSMRQVYAEDPWKEAKKWFHSVKYEEYTIQSYDDLTLYGKFIPHEEHPERVVIIAHGYGQSNLDMAPWVHLFYDLGYSILLPDARGHGNSQGNYIGFGWHERLDYLEWIDWLNSTYNHPNTVLFGLSMGASTVMNVSGEPLPDNVKAIIEDCGYSSTYEELAYQLRAQYKLPAFPFLPLTSIYTKYRANYSFKEASPLEQIQKSQLPILFIHGGKDEIVPSWMVHELYEVADEPKELYFVEEATHGYAYVLDKETYRQRIASFLAKYI